MTLQEAIVLLPCNSLEDLSLDRRSDEAEQLLAAWSALYHPAIIHAADRMPTWGRVSSPLVEPAHRLFVVPPFCRAEVPEEWIEKAATAEAIVLDDFQGRDDLLAAVLESLELATVQVDPELARDFLALGYCHLVVELLTRQLRYMSNLDEMAFQREATAAATAAVQGDATQARERLRSAFDLLTEAREYFYPVEAYLLDLTLVAGTTIGESLRAEIAGREHTNLLVTGEVIEQIAQSEPATLAAIKEGLDKGSLGLVGGEFDEPELPFLPAEAALAHLRRGLESHQRYLGHRPTIFGRRRFGLSPALPQILRKTGFAGAMHFTLDDGKFPRGNQSKVRWEGFGGAIIDSLARLPLDASQSDCFLRLSEKLGDVLDLDHAATAVFAHWPGRAAAWYDDLRRMSQYSPVLGKFTSIGSYFRDTEYVGKSNNHSADQYRSPYLRQAVAGRQPDPLSRWVRYHRRHAMTDALRTLVTMSSLIGQEDQDHAMAHALVREAENLPADGTSRGADLDERLQTAIQEAVSRLAAALPRQKGASEQGCLLVNPSSFAQRVFADVSGWTRLPDVAGPVKLAGESAARKHASIEVPAMGFAWVSDGPAQTADQPAARPRLPFRRRQKPKEEQPLAEENILRNEFFQVQIDPVIGSVKSIRDYTGRDNRLSQQLAYRFPPSARMWDEESVYEPEGEYSLMAADRISVTSSGPMVGETKILGRLTDRRGNQLAGFVETLRVRRGSRVLELAIDLDIRREPEEDPWQSYYAARFAWNDATADVYRSLGSVSVPTDGAQVESPDFVDVRVGKAATTILTGGLPHHRRVGLRMLDTLLIVRGETARSFRLGIGLDLGYPWPAALEFSAPETMLAQQAPPPIARSGWLFHIDSKNVVATCWEPLVVVGRVTGVRARLMETEGRKGLVGLRSFRPIQAARKVDLRGELLEQLKVEGDRIEIPFAAHEWAQVEAEFVPAR